MISLRAKLTAAFLAGILLVSAVVLAAVFVGLHEELHDGGRELTHPDRPDHVMSHVLSEQDVAHVQSEIGRLVLVAGIPAIALAVTLGWWLAGRSLRPLRRLNEELRQIGPQSLSKRVSTRASGAEDGELRQQVNELLARVESGFDQLKTFSTHVAH